MILFDVMTVRAGLTLARVILHLLTTLIEMVADIAFLNLGCFVVLIMVKGSCGPLMICKGAVV